jgi:flavin-dependent dehydrogenase
MDACDVLIVGGGPAGSACATRLAAAGVDVLVCDASTFPRHKVCAGWITPPVIDELQIDVHDYRRGRSFQPITGFRTGLIHHHAAIETRYDEPVSFGIRRCEFDDYLLRRSRARLQLGVRIREIRRDERHWIVNGAIRAKALVGAGGHFCPVARWLNPSHCTDALVVAQETEFEIDPGEQSGLAVSGETPELFFSQDLMGYGWCFRKENYLNVGFGRVGHQSLPKGAAEFLEFLKTRHHMPVQSDQQWNGHAYLLSEPTARRIVDSAVLLIGDAAGLAYPESGEGIRPGIESGLFAAEVLIEAHGQYPRERLNAYERRIHQRFHRTAAGAALRRTIPPSLAARLGRRLMNIPWFVRHGLLDRGFLHRFETQLSAVG